MEQEDPAPEYTIRHIGKIRETLSKRGYYISPLGIIMNDKEDDYSLGDIRYTHGLRKLFFGKEEVILSEGGIEGKPKLIWLMMEEEISFRKAKLKKMKLNARTPQLAVQD